MDELTREYRKAAEQAIRQGDFRRAAYIYGKLLGDDRMAAQALQRGGLHHDAAILYLKKVNDRAAAAQAFEAAGQVDRAIELYRQLGQHEAAGDLLRRIGDEAGAVAEYLSAVDRAMDVRAAGLVRGGPHPSYKVGLLEPAIDAFGRGWDRRPAANATACALELAVIHAGRGEIEPLRDLLDEADAFFRSVGSARDAEAFYNRMAVIAAAVPALAPFGRRGARPRPGGPGPPPPPPGRGRMPGRAVGLGALRRALALAGVLRPRRAVRRGGRRPSRSATRDLAGRRRPARRRRRSRSAAGSVTAACQASATAELFLGFADGKVLAFRPGRNQVVPVGELAGPVAAMAADPDGQVVVALCRTEHGDVLTARLQASRRDRSEPGPMPTSRVSSGAG